MSCLMYAALIHLIEYSFEFKSRGTTQCDGRRGPPPCGVLACACDLHKVKAKAKEFSLDLDISFNLASESTFYITTFAICIALAAYIYGYEAVDIRIEIRSLISDHTTTPGHTQLAAA